MAACKLYIRSGGHDWLIGTFPSKEKAEAYYRLAIAWLETTYGLKPEPIYVEQGKGRVHNGKEK